MQELPGLKDLDALKRVSVANSIAMAQLGKTGSPRVALSYSYHASVPTIAITA